MAPSPNGQFIAAFAASGALLVIASDFSRHISELSTHSPRPPRQLVWCGADSLLLPWDKLLLMVGPFGDSVRYSYPSPPLLHSESYSLTHLLTYSLTYLLTHSLTCLLTHALAYSLTH